MSGAEYSQMSIAGMNRVQNLRSFAAYPSYNPTIQPFIMRKNGLVG